MDFGVRHLGEVIGFRGNHVLSMPLGSSDGIRFGDPVTALGMAPQIEVGEALIGRVLDALGQPIDGGRCPSLHAAMPIDRSGAQAARPDADPDAAGHRHPGDRWPADGRPRAAGGDLRRLGVGKSTLIGMMTRNSEAEVIVVGLVGERGREVGEFLAEALGERGRARAVVLVSTSDQSPLLRMRAALGATTVAEYFARQGQGGAAGARFADPLRHGRARDGSGGGRAADGQGLYALGLQPAGAADRACRAVRARARLPRFIRC